MAPLCPLGSGRTVTGNGSRLANCVVLATAGAAKGCSPPRSTIGGGAAPRPLVGVRDAAVVPRTCQIAGPATRNHGRSRPPRPPSPAHDTSPARPGGRHVVLQAGFATGAR